MFEILQDPFMQRALLAGAVLGVVLAYLGIFAMLKRMAFFSGGIAHASLAGVAIGVIASIYPLATALVFSVAFALIIYALEHKARLPSDAIIGILFSSGMALGVFLMSFRGGGEHDLVEFLFGNIAAITMTDLFLVVPLGILLAGLVAFKQHETTLLALSPELAYLSGVNTRVYQPLFYVFLSVAVVLGVKLVGVVLASALMIIPVSTAKLVTHSFRSLIAATVAVGVTTVVGGIIISYYASLAAGPFIVLFGTLFFIAAIVFHTLATHGDHG